MNGSISFNDIQPLFELIEQEKSFEKRVALLGTRIEKIYIYRERSIKMEGDRRGVSRRSSVKRVAI